jgi:NADH-quinone oxidoreductase subunit N
MWTLLLAALLITERPLVRSSFFHNSVLLDPFIRMRKTIILLAGRAVLIIGMGYMKQEQINAFEYIILILFAILGMLFLVSSQDLITFYLAIEMQRLSLYALAAFKRDSAFSTEAGLKYFILGALSSGLLLLGASLLYGFTGTTNFSEMATFFAGIDRTFNSSQGRRVDLLRFTIPGIRLGVICLRVSLLFKISAAPFHA